MLFNLVGELPAACTLRVKRRAVFEKKATPGAIRKTYWIPRVGAESILTSPSTTCFHKTTLTTHFIGCLVAVGPAEGWSEQAGASARLSSPDMPTGSA
jgi:hypothetical protein